MRQASRSRILAPALVALALAAPGRARADRVVRGVVVALEAGEAYFDVPAATGVEAGAPARIKHPIRLRHPVTREVVADELPVGATSVALVGESLSMAQLGTLAAEVQIGDVVEVLVPGEPDQPPGALELAPPPPIPAVDPDTAAVLEVWRQSAGARLDVRIAAWERFLSAHPDSAHADAVREDLELLHELRRRAPTPLVDSEPVVAGAEHGAPSRALGGEPMPVAVALRAPDEIVAAWLHYRRRGDDTYHRADLRAGGDGYLRGAIPGHAVAAPGLEYFVEVATTAGDAGAAVGRPDAPLSVAVAEPPASDILSSSRGRSRIGIRYTYLDYATFDEAGPEDVFSLFEADFLYRLRADWLYGVRMGMGVLSGRGGHVDRPPEGAGFQYGYTELEFRTSDTRAILARLVAGLGKEGLGFGAEGRLRLGREDGSNLSFAVSSLEEIGFLSEVRMQWAAVSAVPLGFAVAVTDQPTGGDLGVRLSADIGVRALSWMQPTLRISYQGRSVEHSGLGAGLGMVFDW